MWDERKKNVALNLNAIQVGICTVREDYTISLWNQTLETWTGISRDMAMDRRLEEIVPLFGQKRQKERLRLLFRGGVPTLLSSRFHPRIFPLRDENQNEGRYQRITMSLFELPEGEVRVMIAVEDVTAITEQVLRYRMIKDQIAFELEEKKKTGKALAMALSKLNTLSSITRHDLNNILTAFEGYIVLSLAEKPEGKILRYLERMKDAASVMRHQIAFAKDYQDMGNTLPTWVRMDTLIRSAAAEPVFAGISITSDLKDLEILADPLIFKAVYNLLENAIRHGEHTTRIEISGEHAGDDLLILFEDNGKGVPSVVKERIFNKGFGSNTGLGLFLTREILGITGMTIHETGVEGTGARFEIRVPPDHFRYTPDAVS